MEKENKINKKNKFNIYMPGMQEINTSAQRNKSRKGNINKRIAKREDDR